MKKKENCNEIPIVALRGQGNVYFPNIKSSIYIPLTENEFLIEIKEKLDEPIYKDFRDLLSLKGRPGRLGRKLSR